MNKKNQVQCVVTGKLGEKLEVIPYPGKLGQKIYENVSKEGWQKWLGQLTMVINDYGLRSCDEPAKELIEEQMQSFFFAKQKDNQFKPPE